MASGDTQRIYHPPSAPNGVPGTRVVTLYTVQDVPITSTVLWAPTFNTGNILLSNVNTITYPADFDSGLNTLILPSFYLVVDNTQDWYAWVTDMNDTLYVYNGASDFGIAAIP